MATLAERLAARKVLPEAALPSEVLIAVAAARSASPSAIIAEMEDATTVVKKEPVIQTGKPLTFAEKLALKRAEVLAPVQAAPVQAVLPQAVQEKVKASILSVLKDAIEADDLQREEYTAAPEEVKQGYRDIKGRVLALGATDDDDLATAMTELKKALLQNPNACLLMLDEDIGKMTLALRRLTQEALVEGTKAKAEKKPGAKKKTAQVPLSAEDMQKVFDEL